MRLMHTELDDGQLLLQDGGAFAGRVFGFPKTIAGEVVFNTAMVGYPESLTDPSYRGQILVLTYPLIGNYGIPAETALEELSQMLESNQIHVRGLIVSEYCEQPSHWQAKRSLGEWLKKHKIPAIQ